MNKKQLMIQRKKVWYSYHIPGCGNLARRKINAVFLSPINSIEHEMEKCRQCYMLLKQKKKFMTEAVDNKTKERADIIVLDDGERIEIETTPERAKRFEGKDVTVIKLYGGDSDGHG